MTRFATCAALSALVCMEAIAILSAAPPAALPENLAPKANITANSEHGNRYRATNVADGKIPSAGDRADLSKAWCVNGDAHRNGAEITFAWPKPVTVAQLAYYGRVSWMPTECWKGYEVYLDGADKPALSGQFEMGEGPQKITLAAPVSVSRLTLRFTSSYGGLNPGAAEIQIFASPAPDDALPPFRKLSAEKQSAEKQSSAKPALPPVMESPELAADLVAGKLGVNKIVAIKRYEINPSHVYTQHVEGFKPGGGLYVATPAKGGPELKELVSSTTGQILDLDVSYDGGEILFSWKQDSNDSYHLYTINADGSNLKQLTEGKWHDYNGCFLPDGGIAFLSTRSARFAYCWISPVGVLYRMDRDGTHVRRLSSSIVNDFTPSVRNDGRLMYSRWEYVDKPAIPIQSIWTINPDGTALSVFFGNRVLSPATFMDARSIPGTTRVLCVMTSHNGPARGAVGMIDPVYGNNSQEAITNLTPEVHVDPVDKGSGNNVHGPYENPYPLGAEYFLVSRKGEIIVRDYAGSRQARVISPSDGMGYYAPTPLGPRETPPVIASTLPERTGEEGWATIFLQDVYNGLEPEVKRGEIKQICVVQEMKKSLRVPLQYRAFDFQFPVISCGATYASKTVWGYVPVDEDGSACFQVPAGVPLYFMAIDAQGRALQRMRSFTHFMPGETQGCMGCHENRLSTVPVHRPMAMNREARKVAPPEWGGPEGFDYSKVVQPVLDRHCVRCHSGATPPNKVDLSGDKTDYFSVSYEWLARGRKGDARRQWDSPYVSWIPTYNGMEHNILQIAPRTWGSPKSKLADIAMGAHVDANGRARFEMSDAERRRIFAWIDLNIPYYGTSESAYPAAEGCRRLLPPDLGKTLADVARRRCAECHKDGHIPRKVWTRIERPELNDFLLAPLPVSAGGSGACKKAVFADTTDADYQAILKTFEPITEMVKKTPRDDMPGAKPSTDVDRSCK